MAASYGQWQAPPGSESLAAQLDRRLAILEERGYIDGWQVTESGRILAAVYHESDLLVAEALRRGLFDGLEPANLAGVVSAFTFEARRVDDDVARPRQRVVVERLEDLDALRPACAPTSAGWDSGGRGGPTGDWCGPWWPGPEGPRWSRS